MISSLYEPHVGGVENHVKKVSQEIMKAGHEVSVLTRRYDPNLPKSEMIDGIQIHRFPPITLGGIWRWLLHERAIIGNADIIHCHDFAAFFYCVPFRFIYPGKRVYITFHGYEGILPIPSSIKYKRKIAEVLTKANICVGHYIAKWYGTKADMVTYGGVDLIDMAQVEIDTALSNRPIDAVFVGRLEQDTGIMLYLQAIQMLRDKFNRDIEIHICGDGTLRNTIRDFIEKHNLRARLHGFVDPKPFLHQAKFAFVSGYLAILEAMIQKCIVFSVYDNPLKEDYLRMMPSSNLMVISSDAAELAGEVMYHLQNPSASLQKITKAYNYASKQSWSSVASLYLQLWANTRSDL